MTTGKFGSRTFDVTLTRIFTPKDISVSGELSTSEAETTGKKPSTTIKGPGLEKVGLEFRLLAVAGVDIKTEVDAWRALRDAGVAYPLILFGEAVSLNKYLLTSCALSDVTATKVNGQPVMSAATLKLDFTEYQPPGVAASSKTSSSKKSAAGLTSGAVENPYHVPTSTQKAVVKRTNGGMS